MRILVIDDDAYLARAIQRALTRHEVAIETNPEAGVSRVVAADLDGAPFEVVLCDLKMPEMNGLDVLAQVKLHSSAPILMLMSGDDDVVDSARVADGVLVKPFRTNEILEAIERIRGQRSVTISCLRWIPATA